MNHCEGASECHVRASVGTPRGGVKGGGSWCMGSAVMGVVVGALGHEETIYLKHFSIKYLGTLFLFCFYFFYTNLMN